MKITVNGVPVEIGTGVIKVAIEIAGGVERMPEIDLEVTGGTLDVHASDFHRTGDISLHLWR